MHIPGSFPEDSGAITFERLYFTPGDLGFPVFDIDGVRVGIQICHDRNFPEGFRILALRGAEIIFVPTNMPVWSRTWTTESWELVLRARALESGVFIVGIGKAGIEDGTQFVGDSIIISPVGAEVLRRARSSDQELIIAEIDLGQVTEARRRLPWMRDRRPEQYAPLSQ
jgi:predicted amidohydrolase